VHTLAERFVERYCLVAISNTTGGQSNNRRRILGLGAPDQWGGAWHMPANAEHACKPRAHA